MALLPATEYPTSIPEPGSHVLIPWDLGGRCGRVLPRLSLLGMISKARPHTSQQGPYYRTLWIHRQVSETATVSGSPATAVTVAARCPAWAHVDKLCVHSEPGKQRKETVLFQTTSETTNLKETEAASPSVHKAFLQTKFAVLVSWYGTEVQEVNSLGSEFFKRHPLFVLALSVKR